MILAVKETEHRHKDNVIVVKDHIGIIKSHEEVFLNDEIISTHQSHLFKREKNKGVLIDREVSGKNGEAFHLRVICAMHMDFLSRTHIFINGKLEGGDVDKQIYIPSYLPVFILAFFSSMGFFTLCFQGAPLLYSKLTSKSKLRAKINKNSSELYQNDILEYFYESESDLFSLKKKEWQAKCITNSDYHCRLLSYLLSLEGDEAGRVSFSLKSCLNNNPLSCFQTFSSKTFTVTHPSYNKVTESLMNHCASKQIYNDREKMICYNFSLKHYKVVGNINEHLSTMRKLCSQNYDYGCYIIDIFENRRIDFKK
jgi:hypothetical protein